MRKVALNISKDMKKFWMKVEKLVILFISFPALNFKVWHNFCVSETCSSVWSAIFIGALQASAGTQ